MTDTTGVSARLSGMETAPLSGVVHVDRLEGDVIIEFDDGRCALYPAFLLRSMLNQAVQLDGEGRPEEGGILPVLSL